MTFAPALSAAKNVLEAAVDNHPATDAPLVAELSPDLSGNQPIAAGAVLTQAQAMKAANDTALADARSAEASHRSKAAAAKAAQDQVKATPTRFQGKLGRLETLVSELRAD
jgi:hypothetical protein